MSRQRHAEVADCPACGRFDVLVCVGGQLRAHTTRPRGPETCGYLDVIPLHARHPGAAMKPRRGKGSKRKRDQARQVARLRARLAGEQTLGPRL